MKKGRVTEQQVACALHQAEIGASVTEVIRKLEISEQNVLSRKKQYAGTGGGPAAGQRDVADVIAKGSEARPAPRAGPANTRARGDRIT